jgi:hypothetical protein
MDVLYVHGAMGLVDHTTVANIAKLWPVAVLEKDPGEEKNNQGTRSERESQQ